MSTTHADNLKSSWFKQKYYLDGGYLKPVDGQTLVRYNPMSRYKPGTTDQRVTNSLHHLFANIDLSNELKIEEFYSEYGPLGLFENEIINIVAFAPVGPYSRPMPRDSPVAGVQRFSNELVPMSYLQERYHLPKDKLPIPSEGEVVLPSDEASSRYTWESIEDFKNELTKYRQIISLRIALADKDIEQIKALLPAEISSDIYGQKLPSEDGISREKTKQGKDKELLSKANGLVAWAINLAMEGRTYPGLSYDDAALGISKSITWQCDSLLTALYTMIFLDISRGALMKRCKKCGTYFDSMRPNAKYCTESCQGAAKCKRSRGRKGLILESKHKKELHS